MTNQEKEPEAESPPEDFTNDIEESTVDAARRIIDGYKHRYVEPTFEEAAAKRKIEHIDEPINLKPKTGEVKKPSQE